jgi:AraC family transcriptional activator FtrA
MSICSGVFVLAATGLLDGRRATTHWRYADALRERFPEIEVQPDVLYVDEGDLLTSAGSAAGIDLGLHLIRRDFGPEAANTVARRLVVPPHRDGGQAQFVERPVPSVHEASRLGPILDRMRTDLAGAHTIKVLAGAAGMSERTFLRRFEAATGDTPARWLLAERLNRARDLLETLGGRDRSGRRGRGPGRAGLAAPLPPSVLDHAGRIPRAVRPKLRLLVVDAREIRSPGLAGSAKHAA